MLPDYTKVILMIHDLNKKQEEFSQIVEILKKQIDEDDLSLCILITSDKKSHYKVIYARDGSTLFEGLGALELAKDILKQRG